jgi:hypothetical protein
MGVCAVNDAGTSKKCSNTEEESQEELIQGNIRVENLAVMYRTFRDMNIVLKGM